MKKVKILSIPFLLFPILAFTQAAIKKAQIVFQNEIISVEASRSDLKKEFEIPVFIIGKLPDTFKYSDLLLTSSNDSLKVLTNETRMENKSSSDSTKVIFTVSAKLDSSTNNEKLFPIEIGVPQKFDSLFIIKSPNAILRICRPASTSALKKLPVVSLITYSDFQGFKGDRPNGLVQAEANFSFYTNVKSFKSEKSSAVFFRNVVFGFNLTKVEDKLRYKQVNYFIDTSEAIHDTIRHIHTFDLVQYSNFNAYAKINFLTYKWPLTKWKFYADGYGALFSTGVKDTLPVVTEYNLNSIAIGYNLKISTDYEPSEFPINVAFSVKGFHINCYSNSVRQRVGPLYVPDSDKRNNIFQKDGIVGGKSLTVFQLEFQYFPSKENSGKIFFRTSYYNNIFGRVINNEPSNDYGNNFLQVQVGYAGSFTEFLGRFFPEKKAETKPKDVNTGK